MRGIVVLVTWVLGWTAGSVVAQESCEPDSIRIAVAGRLANVWIGDQLFTTYDAESYARPILYPLNAPGAINLARHWPMEPVAPGEAEDHPHHKSLWFAHGDVDGVDFWSEKGTIENQSLQVSDDDVGIELIAENLWKSENATICRERAIFRFYAYSDHRIVDCTYVINADKAIRFGDTKEGTFAIRTHPHLQLKPVQPDFPSGHALNSNGERDFEIWGKAAQWVWYYGDIDGETFGIAILDHPENLRHPTTWHARDYGLVAANPFGLHDFTKAPRGSGDLELAAGDSLKFRYRVLLIRGPCDADQVNTWFQQFSESK